MRRLHLTGDQIARISQSERVKSQSRTNPKEKPAIQLEEVVRAAPACWKRIMASHGARCMPLDRNPGNGCFAAWLSHRTHSTHPRPNHVDLSQSEHSAHRNIPTRWASGLADSSLLVQASTTVWTITSGLSWTRLRAVSRPMISVESQVVRHFVHFS